MRLWFLLALLIAPMASAEEWYTLFDGREGHGSLDGWLQSGPGSFVMAADGSIESQGGMGLFYFAEEQFQDFELEVEWRTANPAANSGIFVRFPSPETPWTAVEQGYEIQIDGVSPGNRGTGSIYSFQAPHTPPATTDGWNRFNITVRGQLYKVSVNGQPVTEFVGNRSSKGHIGLQNHDPNSTTWFRLVRVKRLTPEEIDLGQLVEPFRTSTEQPPIRVLTVTTTHGFRHTGAIEQTHALLPHLSDVTEFDFHITEDVNDLTAENLANYDVLFLANATLRVDEPDEIQADHLTFRRGDFKNLDLALQLPDRQMPGRIALSGEAPNLTGLAEFETGVRVISDITANGTTLVMTWDAGGGIGNVTATLEQSGNDITGQLQAGELKLPVSGTLVEEANEANWGIENPITQVHRDAIKEFVQSGKGLAGAHSALDALYGWQDYRQMVGGGLFESHPWTQPVTINIEADHPTVAHLGEHFQIRDEIYVLDNNPRWSSLVLASIANDSINFNPGPPDKTRSDFPISWLRKYGQGTVFMTKLGHFPDVWTNPLFIQHLLQGLRTAAGRIPGNYDVGRIKETIADNVWPDDIAVDELGNVWIAELRGKVHYHDATDGTTHLAAELRTTDPTKIEHGLLGIEVDPEFHHGSPYIYLFYTHPESFINTLSRFTVTNGNIDLSSEQVLLNVPTDPMCCHQAGDLEWDAQGRLLISTGDTGMSETNPSWELSDEQLDAFKARHDLTDHHWSRLVDSERTAQNLQDLRGKILRINKDGTVPQDNPFFGTAGVRWEIFAYGLRNPYRFKVHPESGDLYIGVVGPDARYDYDEYNVAKGGENFGWPRSIGKLFYNEWQPDQIPNYQPPLWEYTYATGARSATVGPIYQSDGEYAFPAIFKNKMFIYDWSRRWIKWAEIAPGEFRSDDEADVKKSTLDYRVSTPRLTNIRDFDQLTDTTPISMELGPDGSLYVAEFDGFWDAGPNAKVTRYRWVNNASQYQAAETQRRSAGENLYLVNCASCHQTSGQGIAGIYPPLINTPRVANTSELIDIVLNGQTGPIEVNGTTYNGVMAPWRDVLADGEIADLLTYVRSSWGNAQTPVTPEQVAAAR